MLDIHLIMNNAAAVRNAEEKASERRSCRRAFVTDNRSPPLADDNDSLHADASALPLSVKYAER